MTSSAPGIAAPRRAASAVPWIVPIVRAVPAIAAALVTTFTGGHSAQFGLLLLAGWAALSAVADAVAWRLLPSGAARSAALGRAVVGIVVAALAGLVAAGVLGALDDVARTAAFALAAAAMLIVGGMLDVGAGLRTRRTDAFSRDWTTAGVIQLAAAVVILFVPPGLQQRYEVDDVAGLLTGAIIVVGLIGVTAAVLGVLMAIAGFSLRSAPRPAVEAARP